MQCYSQTFNTTNSPLLSFPAGRNTHEHPIGYYWPRQECLSSLLACPPRTISALFKCPLPANFVHVCIGNVHCSQSRTSGAAVVKHNCQCTLLLWKQKQIFDNGPTTEEKPQKLVWSYNHFSCSCCSLVNKNTTCCTALSKSLTAWPGWERRDAVRHTCAGKNSMDQKLVPHLNAVGRHHYSDK